MPAPLDILKRHLREDTIAGLLPLRAIFDDPTARSSAPCRIGPCRIGDRGHLAQQLSRAHLAGMTEMVLDVKGMNCPLPVLKANRTLRSMPAGGRLRVLATDRAAVGDFQAFCRETGHALLAWSEEAGVFSFVIRRRVDVPEQKGH